MKSRDIHLGFSVSELGIDPYLRRKKDRSEGRVGQNTIHIDCCCEGALFERRDGMGLFRINLSNYLPIGRLEEGVFSGLKNTNTVKKNGRLTVRPEVFQFGNYAYWSAKDTMTVETDGNGRFIKVEGTAKFRH